VNVTYLPGQNKRGDLTVQICLCSALGSLCVSSYSLALCKTSSISIRKPLSGWSTLSPDNRRQEMNPLSTKVLLFNIFPGLSRLRG